jgi:hypothetical protein
VRLIFAEDGRIKASNGAEVKDLTPYEANQWYDVRLDVDAANGTFDISLGGKQVATTAAFAEFVKSVERISFRTGPHREGPTLQTTTAGQPDQTNPNPDVPEPEAVFYIDDVTIEPKGR